MRVTEDCLGIRKRSVHLFLWKKICLSSKLDIVHCIWLDKILYLGISLEWVSLSIGVEIVNDWVLGFW